MNKKKNRLAKLTKFKYFKHGKDIIIFMNGVAQKKGLNKQIMIMIVTYGGAGIDRKDRKGHGRIQDFIKGDESIFLLKIKKVTIYKKYDQIRSVCV